MRCPGTASFIRADTADTASCWSLNSTETAQMALDRSPLQAGVPGACPSICSASPGARGNPFDAEWARARAGNKAAAFQHHCFPPLRGCARKQAPFYLLPGPGRDGRCFCNQLGCRRRDWSWWWSFSTAARRVHTQESEAKLAKEQRGELLGPMCTGTETMSRLTWGGERGCTVYCDLKYLVLKTGGLFVPE